MADNQKVAVLAPTAPGSDNMVMPQDAKMRKELNAYAVMAYVAVSDRNAMAEQLKGLTHLTQAVNELQEKLATAEQKAEDLQLEVWRNEAFVNRSRIQLRVKDSELAGLREELKKGKKAEERSVEGDGGGERSKAEEDESVDGSAEEKGEPDQREHASGETEKPKSPQPGKKDYLMSHGLHIGVSREIHEAVVQENLHLKGHLKRLLTDQGASLKDLMDTIQYREIIKQLKRSLEEKEEEIAKIKHTLEQANSPKEETAKLLLEMEGKVKNSERTIKMNQVMNEALSSRVEELTKALQKLQRREEIQMAHMRSPFSDGSTLAIMADPSVDQVLPSMQIKNLTKENARLMKVQKRQETEKESLRQERDAAVAEKTEIQRRLTALSHIKSERCSSCQNLKAAKERAEDELNITKGEMTAALYQVETYKSDFKERCSEMEKEKSGLRNELDTWKRNYHMLNKQMERLVVELEKLKGDNSKLHAENQYLSQTLSQLRNESSVSMPLIVHQRCQDVNPWQETRGYASRRSEIAVGGRDRSDMSSPQEDATAPQSHQWTTARPSSSGGRRRRSKLKCLRCTREFSPERQQEFEDHQRNCPGNS
ncbi:myosin-4-like [Lytechinus variegatus]|uniref:myosin-4-like n=1 Tax=Lytechinus variegatus TaxID=7654 RepID=UPI001BB0FD5C|nr:myosin-4-like [Lytechinus variegatus]